MLVLVNTLNTSAEQVESSKGGGGGTAAAVVVTLLVLAGAIAGYVWHDRHSKQQQQQDTRDAVLGGGEVLEMIENPLRRRTGDGAAATASEINAPDFLEPVAMGAGGAAAAGTLPAAAASADAGGGTSIIYAPPAWIPRAQESPAYYSNVAAAPRTAAEYAAPNDLGGHTVYVRGKGGSNGAAAYASPIEGRGPVYLEGGSDTAAAYASITNGGGMDALYTNDAYGNVAGSTA